MTDRHIAYTVTLQEAIREDDAQAIIDAIKMVKGVNTVVPVVANAETYYAEEKVKRDLKQAISKCLE